MNLCDLNKSCFLEYTRILNCISHFLGFRSRTLMVLHLLLALLPMINDASFLVYYFPKQSQHIVSLSPNIKTAHFYQQALTVPKKVPENHKPPKRHRRQSSTAPIDADTTSQAKHPAASIVASQTPLSHSLTVKVPLQHCRWTPSNQLNRLPPKAPKGARKR